MAVPKNNPLAFDISKPFDKVWNKAIFVAGLLVSNDPADPQDSVLAPHYSFSTSMVFFISLLIISDDINQLGYRIGTTGTLYRSISRRRRSNRR